MTSKAKAVVFSIAIICACIVACIWAPEKNESGCCGKCDCAAAWKLQGEINSKTVEHLRRNGVVIGSQAPVGSAK